MEIESKEIDDSSRRKNKNKRKRRGGVDVAPSLYSILFAITNKRRQTHFNFLKDSINNIKNLQNGEHESIALDVFHFLFFLSFLSVCLFLLIWYTHTE